MKVSVLLENATPSSRFIARHGLSLLLDTDAGERILFDMGPDASFLQNAATLGIDMASVDVAVISHGHADHGGGLGAFLEATDDAAHPAPVFVRQGAFAHHFSGTKRRYREISLDAAYAESERVVETGQQYMIAPGVMLFSDVERRHPEPASNARLFELANGLLVPDGFAHEQSLLIIGGARSILVSGCSHAGILNIIERAEELAGGPLDVVIAGFHLMSPSSGVGEENEAVRRLARQLAEKPTQYYTFHCTGADAFGILRDELGERVRYLATGSVITI